MTLTRLIVVLCLTAAACESAPTQPTPTEPRNPVVEPVEPVEPLPPGGPPPPPVTTCATALDTRPRTDDIAATPNGFTLSAIGPDDCTDIVAVSTEDWLTIDNGGWSCHHQHPRNCRTSFYVTENDGAERYATITITGLPGQQKLIRQADKHAGTGTGGGDGGDDGGSGEGVGGGGGSTGGDPPGFTCTTGRSKTSWQSGDRYCGELHSRRWRFFTGDAGFVGPDAALGFPVYDSPHVVCGHDGEASDGTYCGGDDAFRGEGYEWVHVPVGP